MTQETDWDVRLTDVRENTADGCFTVGLSEDEQGAARHLILQCSLQPPDEQDVRLGMDTYCTITEEGATAYGGVAGATLRDSVLRLRFTPATADELELTEPSLSLRLRVPGERITELGRALRRVLTYGTPDHRPAVLDLEV
ncbi:Imm10 family immunity protein [Streptomyces sp. RFCAC02]|uniref:Imm10 family immunity protein n=1 Tax=Streptomyces sp. RFCAC02 TaxID=2499143 RepID=UPI00143CC763|nr:Imm10 family immunity protein [Streptomyces sp. RFCAC02]